ncbi:MAG: hypothetical protein ING75_15270 [Rhodocyclaceae bacterium]|nr:hypothetical protein [Rhodocyclaceae bacterium]
MAPLDLQFWKYQWGRISQGNPIVGYLILALSAALLAALVSACIGQLRIWEANSRLDGLRRLEANGHAPKAPSGPRLERFSSSEFGRELLSSSKAAGVEIQNATFSLELPPQAGFLKYTARFETAAPYPAVRAMVSKLLTALPHGALEEFSCSKGDRDERFPRCSIHLSAFYLRGESAR